MALKHLQRLATIYTGTALSAILWVFFFHYGPCCLLSVHVLKEQSRNVPGNENGTAMPPPHQVYRGYGERARAQSTSGKVHKWALD